MEQSQTQDSYNRTQAAIWDLPAKEAIPQVIKKTVVNDMDWQLLIQVPQGAFVQLRELLLYNGDATSTKWRLAILNSTETAPTGITTDEPFVYQSGEIDAGKSDNIKLQTGLRQGWRVYAFSDAGAGVNFNLCLTGMVLNPQ